MALQRLKEAAEKAKDGAVLIHRNQHQSALYHCRCLRPKHLDVKLTRAKLESLVADLLDKLEAPAEQL
jgi:molecular chaperone DnaK